MKKDHEEVLPKKGLIVRVPKTFAVLPEDKPTTVPVRGSEGAYWRRKLALGDVVLATESSKAEEKEPEDASTESSKF